MSYSIHRLHQRLTPEEEEMDIYDFVEQRKKKARGKKAAQDGDELDDEFYYELDDELDDELNGCEPADELEYKPVRLCQDGDTLWLKIDEDFKTSRFHFNFLSWYNLLELAVNYGWEPLRSPDHYCGSRGQVVNGKDTKNLVTALQRAHDDLARIIPTEPSSEMCAEPDWESLSPEEFWTYGYNLERLKGFVDFALKADYGLRIT